MAYFVQKNRVNSCWTSVFLEGLWMMSIIFFVRGGKSSFFKIYVVNIFTILFIEGKSIKLKQDSNRK